MAPHTIQMQDDWLSGLRAWAAKNENIRELWLFGSRARGDAKDHSDVDIALALMPPVGKTDWALGAYFDFESEWKQQLKAIVERDVSIEPLVPGTEDDVRLRRGEGKLIWARK
jgi:predicted nucleotidyltransferase